MRSMLSGGMQIAANQSISAQRRERKSRVPKQLTFGGYPDHRGRVIRLSYKQGLMKCYQRSFHCSRRRERS